MNQLSALAAANFLNQATLPLIQAATVPQIANQSSSASSTQDRVSISSEARAFHAAHS